MSTFRLACAVAALTACNGSSPGGARGGTGGPSSGGDTANGGGISATGGVAGSRSTSSTPATGGRSGTGGGMSTGGASSGGGASTGGAGTGGMAGSSGTGGSTGGTTGAGGASAAAGGNAAGGRPGDAGVGGNATGGRTTGAGGNLGGSNATGGRTGTGGVTSSTAGAGGGGGGSSVGGTSGGGAPGSGGNAAGCGSTSLSYDQTILCDEPVAYLAMSALAGSEPDLTGNGHAGSYKGGNPQAATLPNGEQAADFNGSSQYLTIPSHAAFSIPTTGNLTWEAWIRPDVLQFPNDSNGYVDWMGKCADYAPTCEWEARMYSTTNSENRCNRISAYVFNPSAGLGSAADWQPTCGLIQAGQWYHVVGQYTLASAPSDCASTSSYPGSIEIWVNGVKWNHASHGQTGCMSQYSVVPKANSSPVNIGTMAGDAWFPGAIGKVAFYGKLLSQATVSAHYKRMTGKDPTGTCASSCSF